MNKPACWLLVFTAALLAIGLAPVSAQASSFTPVIDEFWIVKNGTEVFRDSFSDGSVPPSGPSPSSPYATQGGAGFTGESGGQLTMTPSLGAPVLITAVFADLFTGAVTPANVSSDATLLHFEDSFSIHGLYNLSTLPAIVGQSFGIGTFDRTATSAGNDVIRLMVAKSALTGDIIVRLAHFDFVADLATMIAALSIQDDVATADQIELMLSKGEDSDLITASFLLGGILTPLPSTSELLHIYRGEDFTRAQFFSTDRVPVPEPSTLILLGIGLAGLAGTAWRARRTS